MPLAPLKMAREPLCSSSEVVCCAFPAPQRVFFWDGSDVSPYQTVSDSQQTQGDITTALHLIHDTELSCTNTMAPDFKKKKKNKIKGKWVLKDNRDLGSCYLLSGLETP